MDENIDNPQENQIKINVDFGLDNHNVKSAKQEFAEKFQISPNRLASIADDMQSTKYDNLQSYFRQTRSEYFPQRAGLRQDILNRIPNEKIRRQNVRPIKKTMINLNQDHFNKIDDYKKPEKNFVHDINPGAEESLSKHSYDDTNPIAISVDDFSRSLYVPKTVQYIWMGQNIDYDKAVKLKQDIQIYLSLTDQQRFDVLQSMTDVSVIEEKHTLHDACDVGLIGQKGVFAKRDIHAFSILGIYSGIFIANEEEMIKLAHKMPLEDFQDYMFRIALQDSYPKVTGYQYGNRLSLVNAASNYRGDKQKIQAQLRRRSNIMLVVVKSGECPIAEIHENEDCPDVLFFTANREIKAGEQLLFDYGPSYW